MWAYRKSAAALGLDKFHFSGNAVYHSYRIGGKISVMVRHAFRSCRANLFCVALLATAAVAPMLIAAIRAPGKYNGVVLYDRWDNCYLFSGVYLMYISDAIKGALRPYRGKSMEVDAKEVEQPWNPGDGLIKKLAVIGESIDNPRTPSILGIDLRATISELGTRVKATIEISNRGPKDALVDPHELGFAVIAHDKPFICPSNGTSPVFFVFAK
jgi:hypothetical protein